MKRRQQKQGKKRNAYNFAMSRHRRKTLRDKTSQKTKKVRHGWGVFAHGIRVACGGWLCDLGAVGASSIFGLVRGAGSFAAVLPTLVLVSRIQLARCQWGYHRVWIVRSPIAFADFSLVDLIFIYRYF